MCLSFAAAPAAKADATISVRVSPLGPTEYNKSADSLKRPGLIDPLCGLTVTSGGGSVVGPSVNAAACDSQDGREWEGLNSTDYLTTLSIDPNVPPNPDIAVGPDDILTVVNGIIARYPNYNAPNAVASNTDSRANLSGTLGVPYTAPPATLGAYTFPPTSRQWLDVWLGEGALLELCPTQPRSFATCVINNTSVRYDQMQGRFIVLFTVVDTGGVHCKDCGNTVLNPSARRKATWVMIVSKWATGCQSVTVPANFLSPVCVPNTDPSAPPLPGNTLFFTSANPPGLNQSNPNSGGLNGNWISYYGIADGTCDGTCAFGNINSISDIRRGNVYTTATPASPVIDCYNTSIGLITSGTVSSNRVCYLPSSARLGIDNDNIIISSSVYNDNVPLNSRILAVTDPDTQFQYNVPFEGTRLRVHKKAGIYTGVSSIPAAGSGGEGCIFNATKMCPGSTQPLSGGDLQGDFYDLWDVEGATRYTFDRVINQPVPGGSNRNVPGPHYEPEHVRGRSLASYNGNANLDNAFSAIWGAVNQGYTATSGSNPPQIYLYHRTIRYTREPQGLLVANGQSIPATVNLPKIQGGIPDLWAIQRHEVPQFQNPDAVTQRAKLAQPTPNNVQDTPYLYVGDNRPHRVISREGHRYIARVGATPTFVGFAGSSSSSTVIYDIVQKLTAGANGGEVYNTQWGNGDFYAPMFDTPANVVQYGSISPINVAPFLEKLFVGTTYPALAPSDTRLRNYGNVSTTSLLACTGQEPGVTSGTSGRAYPSLYDMRCGEDAYDRRTDLRHPISAAFNFADFQVREQPVDFAPRNTLVPFGIRGGASTDVNNMGLWLYGAYAKARLSSVAGFGQWGTYVAHYPLTFPIRDPYNNLILSYPDVPPGHVFYPYVQIARQTEIEPGARNDGPTVNFNPNEFVKRGVMAKWTVRAQMDEKAITDYLNSTGGAFCSFADACGITIPNNGTVTDTLGTSCSTSDPNPTCWRYVEVMYRRGYTKGCADTNDGQRRFCPGNDLTRGEMAVFIVRAKTNSVFPTVTSGAFTTVSCQPNNTNVAAANVGDQFGLFIGCNGYFTDVANTHVYYAFIQKLRELRITNGTDLVSRLYSPGDKLTKGQLMTFLVRAFFP
jgi:hypothetical protein